MSLCALRTRLRCSDVCHWLHLRWVIVFTFNVDSVRPCYSPFGMTLLCNGMAFAFIISTSLTLRRSSGAM